MPDVIDRIRLKWRKNWPEIHCALRGGLPAFLFQKRPIEPHGRVFVFCYHVVDSQSFQRDLEFLRRNEYRTIDANDLLLHMTGEKHVPDRSIVITFDDGPQNFYRVAFPLLQQYRMNAVAFLATAFHEQRHRVPETARESCPCTWSQIAEMHESGLIDFQSHTHQHRYVPRWPEPLPLTGSPAEVICRLRGEPQSLADDFRTAKQILESKLNKTVHHLAFPMYQGTNAALRIGSDCGYRTFWWGVLPRRPGNDPGDPPTKIVRLSGEFIRRLPGVERTSLRSILRRRYARPAGQ